LLLSVKTVFCNFRSVMGVLGLQFDCVFCWYFTQ